MDIFCYGCVCLPRLVLLLLFTTHSGLEVDELAGVATVEKEMDGQAPCSEAGWQFTCDKNSTSINNILQIQLPTTNSYSCMATFINNKNIKSHV